MNTKLAFALSFTAVLCIGFIGQAFAITYFPGVKSGDTFSYDLKTYWSTDNASATVPNVVKESNNTAQLKVTISLVSDVNATATYVWDFTNGTEIAYLLTQDVNSGLSYYSSYAAPPIEIVVGANISMGHILHPNGTDFITVNQTISRNYASGARDINVIQFINPIVNSATDNTTVGISTDTYYIDKATGVIVEQNSKIEHTANPAETQSFTWTLKQTNVWDASAPSTIPVTTILIIVAIIAVIAVIATIYLPRRKGKRKKSRR
jgi:hypothetical protein